MKVVIRSCNQRLWYVENFLVKQLKSQGVDETDIIVRWDENELEEKLQREIEAYKNGETKA